MRAVGMGVAAALLASCVQLPEPGLATTGAESDPHVQAWLDEWEKAGPERSPLAHKRRAELAYEALTFDIGRVWGLMGRGVNFHELAVQGRRSLAFAVLATPNDPELFALLALWESRLERNPKAAAQAACHAATLSNRSEYLELCGDALKEAGETALAVARWKAALQLAEAGRRFSLLSKIELEEGTGFEGVAPDVVRQYRFWKLSRERPVR